MALTKDDVLVGKMGRGKRVTGLPSIDRSLMGAPATMEGSGTGDGKTAMTGTPVQSAVVPPAVTADLKGAPQSGVVVQAPPVAVEASSEGSPASVSYESQEATTPAVEPPTTTATPEKTTSTDQAPTAITTTQAPIQSRVDVGQGEANKLLYDKSIGLPDTGKYNNWQDVIDFLERRKAEIHLPTEEDLKKEARRKKTEGIISAIADGASAISNLVFTTQYAPNMYDAGNSMTGKWKERYDRIKKEHEADADRYLNYAMTIGKIKDAQDDKEYQRGRDKLTDDIRQKREDREAIRADINAKKAELQIAILTDKKRALELQNEIKEQERNYAATFYQNRANGAGGHGRSSGGSGRRSGGGGKNADNIVYAINEKGEVYDTGERTSNYPESVKRSAKNGVVVEKVTESTSSDRQGEKKSTRSTRTEVRAGKKQSAKSSFSIHK